MEIVIAFIAGMLVTGVVVAIVSIAGRPVPTPDRGEPMWVFRCPCGWSKHRDGYWAKGKIHVAPCPEWQSPETATEAGERMAAELRLKEQADP